MAKLPKGLSEWIRAASSALSVLLFSCQSVQPTATLANGSLLVQVASGYAESGAQSLAFIKLEYGDAKFISESITRTTHSRVWLLNLIADERQNAILVGGSPNNVEAAVLVILAMDH